jgi:hypothetical protein
MKSFPKKQQVKTAEKAAEMPLGAVNYIMIALGALVLAGSYGIMFLEKEVDGFFALFISPVALVSAYGWIIFAILHRPTQKNNR